MEKVSMGHSPPPNRIGQHIGIGQPLL